MMATCSKPPTVIVHLDYRGCPTYLVHGNADVYVIDERSAKNTVHTITARAPHSTIRAILGGARPRPLGEDLTYEQLLIQLFDRLDGRHYRIVRVDEGESL